MGRYLRPPGVLPLTVPSPSTLPSQGATPMQAIPIVPVRRGGSVTNDKGYWHSPGAIVPYQRTGSILTRRPAPPPLLKDTPHGEYYPELGVESQLPPWQDPSYHSKPLEETFTCPGVPWYQTWTTVQSFDVEGGWMYVIRGLCFEIPAIAIGDVFEMSIISGGMTLCSFFSMKISADPNPALQYAIGGPQRPVPVYGIADQNNSVQIRIRVLGPQSTAGTFSKVNSDPFGAAVTTSLIGWKAPRVSTRDGGPLPGDVFPVTIGIPTESRYDLDAIRDKFHGGAV